MKKLLVLVFALIAVLGLTFAVSAADTEKLTGLADVSKLYYANNNEIVGGGMNGGSYMHHLFDGSYGACYNNNVGSYIVTDLNAKLPGGYYVSEIKIYHSNNSKFSLYYSVDGGATWKTVVENAQVTEATYAVGETVTQVKYVFTTCANWVASAKEIEIYGMDPSQLACLHTNLSADGWVPVPGSATCTGVGKVAQTCPDCGEVQEQVSNDVLPLGHDLITTVTRPGTSVSYGAATLKCSRCEYTIDFSGEVNLTSPEYSSIGESQQFTNVLVSSIADLWGASTVENMFKGDWVNIGPFHTWVAAGEDDSLEYVILNFQGEIDLTKIKVLVQNDSGGTLVISALNDEGEYVEVRNLQTYDEAIKGGEGLVMEVPMLGVTTSSIKIQAFSNWRNTNGYYYNRMVIGELEAYGIAKGCGLDADNHECTYDTFVDFVKAPTCQDAGTATYKCACNATTVVEVAASEDFHSYVELEDSRIPSTCTVGGFYTDKCEFCGAEVTVDLEIDTVNGHEFEVTGRTEPECVKAGSIAYVCLICGAAKEEAIDALGHTYGEPVVVPSTCKDNGTSTETCSVCGDEKVTTLETTGCTWTIDSYVTEPTCGAQGEANYVCSVCGETKVDVVAATGNHAWDTENYDVIVNPSCEGTGAATFTCTVCSATQNGVLPALGHSFTVEVEGTRVDATCEADGSVEMACANCDKTRVETLKATGHDWGEPTDDSVYPTCTEAGTLYYECANCGETKPEPKEATGHVWSDAPEAITPPTCVAAGSGKYYCINCWVVYDEERGEVEIPADPTAHADMIFNDAYTFAICPDCDVFAFYGMHSGVGDNNLTWYFMGDMVNIYSDTLDEYYNTVLAYDEETGIYTVTLVQIVSDDEEVIPVTYAGCTATVVINTDGTLLITLTAADESTLVFGKDPTVVEPENHLLNGTYAYLDMGGNVNAKFKFDNGTIYVLEDNMMLGLPESFPYSYYPATGEIDTGDYGYFFVMEDVIYFGRGWALTPVEDEEPVDPEEPVVNYGNVIGSFEVETTDTYGWFDAYSYTAGATGQYSFYLPAGLGMWRLEYADQWPVIDEDIVGYYDNIAGEYLTIDMVEGETFNFYVASTTTATWTVEVYYYVESVNDEFNGEYYHAESNQLFFTFDNGTLTVVDETGYFNVSGKYSYTYNASTGEFTLDTDAFSLIVVGDVLMFNGQIALDKYVEEQTYALVLGENVFNFTCTNYRYNEYKVIFTAIQAGTYVIAPADGEENLVIFVEDQYGSEMVDVPYVVTLAEGEELELIITTGANVMTTTEDTVEFTLSIHNEHSYVAGEQAEDGSVTYTCVCGDTYVVNNSLVNGEYYMDGTAVVFNNGVLTIGEEVMNYTYNVTSGMIDVAPGMFFQVIDGGIFFRGMGQPLHQHTADSFYKEVTEPTCTTDGYTTYICKFCYGFTYTSDVVPATGHKHVETERVESTCSTEGSVTYTCTCGDSYTESLKLAAHTEVEIPAVRPLPSTNHKGYTAGTMCSVCEAVVVAPQEFTSGTSSDVNFKINSATLSLGEDIGVTYNATHPANSDASSMYMVFIFNGKEYVVESAGVVSGNRYRFVFKGMRADLMAANIEAYVYAIEDGNYVMKSHLQYSVKQYCVNQLKRSIDANFKALIFSVLNLGDCTQLAVDSKTPAEQLISNIVSAETGVEVPGVAVETIDPSYNVQAISGDRTQGYDWKSGGIQLGSSVQLKLQFVATDVEGLVLNFNVDGRIIEVDASELTKGSDGRYTVYFQVKVLEYDKPVTCTFVKDGVQVGSTLTYSVYTYIVRQYANASFPEADKNFVKALYEYAEAVKAMNAAN